MAVFASRCLSFGRPRTPSIESREASALWRWWMEWWVWLWGPVERACLRLGIAPDAITFASTVLSIAAAVLLGMGQLSLGGWLYLFAASLDLVDGRVARAQGRSTRAGAFLDSTLDRVAELFVFGGLAVYLRNSALLPAALAAAGSSVLVSYARARGEALGASAAARVGGMQRAERVVLTGVPCALSPLLDALFGSGTGGLVSGSALALLAVVTSLTVLRRCRSIWQALCDAEPAAHAAGNVRWVDASRWHQKKGRQTLT